MEEHLQREVWRCESWDKFLFIKGQKDFLERLKRAPEEITQAREAKVEERSNGN